MGAFGEQMMGLGLISMSPAAVNVEEQIAAMNRRKEKLQDHFTCDDLAGCQTAKDFKIMARQILRNDVSAIYEIVRKAHEFRGDDFQARESIPWFFYRLREGLSMVPPEKFQQVINRAFRRNGATMEIPVDWLK